MKFIIYLILTIVECIALKIAPGKDDNVKSPRNIICNFVALLCIMYSMYFFLYVAIGQICVIGIDSKCILFIIIPINIVFSFIRLLGNFDLIKREVLYDSSLLIILFITIIFSIIISSFYGDTGNVNTKKEKTIDIVLLDDSDGKYINGVITSKNNENNIYFYYEDNETRNKSDKKVIPTYKSYVEVYESSKEVKPRIEVYKTSKVLRNVYEKEFVKDSYLRYEIYVPKGTVNYTFKNNN